MRPAFIYLGCIFLFSCNENNERHTDSDRDTLFADNSSTERKLSSLILSLDPSGGMPCNLTFYGPGTLVESSAVRISDGVPSGIAVELTQKELERLRSTINEIGTFSEIESFTSARSPDANVKAPDLPHVEKMLARKNRGALQIRSNSIYRDAHYVDEFASISEDDQADEFLRKLERRIKLIEGSKALVQILKRH